MSNVTSNSLLMVIIAILLPPLAVFLKVGIGMSLLINIILCCFFWVPGIIHGVWVITR